MNPVQEGIESDGSLRAGSIRSSIKKTKIDSWDATQRYNTSVIKNQNEDQFHLSNLSSPQDNLNYLKRSP